MRTGELITYRVTSENQPELSRFLNTVAEPPELVELSPVPAVQAHDGLVLGLPLVLGLAAPELAEVVGQELSCRRPQRALAAVGGGTHAALATQAVADALTRAEEVAVNFERFVLRHVGPLASTGYYPADLWDGWRSIARPRGSRAPLRPLGITVETGFARTLAAEFRAGPLRPVTFDEVPPEVWDTGLRRRAMAVRAAAALMLRRPKATGAEILGLVRAGRAAELLARAGIESPELDPAARALTPLLHEALRGRGYRFEQPLNQDVYVGPAWNRVDIADLLAMPDPSHLLA
jgi:hypothetical protein